MLVFAGNDLRELSLYVSLGLENSVVGEYGRSEEAEFVLFDLITRCTKNYPLQRDNFLAKRQPFCGVVPQKKQK